MWLTVQRKLVMLGDELCFNTHFTQSVLKACTLLLQNIQSFSRWEGLWILTPPPPLQSFPPANQGFSHYSWPPFWWANQLEASPPFLSPVCLHCWVSKACLTLSAERKPTERKAHTHTTERIGWLESLKGGAWKYIEEEEKWEVRRVCSMPNRFCIQDTLEVCEWEEKKREKGGLRREKAREGTSAKTGLQVCWWVFHLCMCDWEWREVDGKKTGYIGRGIISACRKTTCLSCDITYLDGRKQRPMRSQGVKTNKAP